MVDTSAKEAQVMKMIEEGEYFVINRPRQYGKTTMLQMLRDVLRKAPEYIGLKLSFEDAEEQHHQSEAAFAMMFSEKIERELEYLDSTLHAFWQEIASQIEGFLSLEKAISKLTRTANKKLVLLIDEVDASSNYIVFLRFLALLRNKYLERFNPGQETFHSIVLAGVHDIKSLKYKMRDTAEAQYNSPWNIAADFKVNMSFEATEIEPMLVEYAQAEHVQMDTKKISAQLYYYTSGYPFLVTKLCKIIAEDLLPKKAEKTWQETDVEAAVQVLLKEQNTNFDSLIKNLENNDDLYALVQRLIIGGDTIPFNQYNPIINQGLLYGVFKLNGQLKIHNRIYEQLIYDYMASNLLTRLKTDRVYAGHFLLEKNQIDMQAVLLKFQQFMKEEHSDKNESFLEEQGRLVFLSFLSPILNGKGYSFKEVQTSMEKRLDVVVTYFQHRYVIELKKWYGPKAHEQGLDQLAEYLDFHGLSHGFLLIFDPRQAKTWNQQLIQHRGKEIFAVWV